MTLGLPFKETDRKYKSGKKEGQNIWTPDIKSKNNIPKEVIKYFDESYNFFKRISWWKKYSNDSSTFWWRYSSPTSLLFASSKWNKKKISTRYKNGVYKYLKAVINFGTKWYDLNFVKVYNKMTNFTNPN